ncbi:MAG: Peptidase S24-like protein [Candidatus Tokpelaia sp. JSC189]|nr:MAG: Peptidase S24-like protein [Candidatus Tokpelaia sp. JSC189]
MLDKILERIDQRLKALGLSESKASVMAGLSNSAIRDIRRRVKDGGVNKSVETKTLASLAKVLKTNVAWLAEGGRLEDIEKNVMDVPLISWVSAGQMQGNEGSVDFSDFPSVAAYDLPRGKWIALRVDGLSMNKVSPPDSIIFVNMSEVDLVPNACYVIADETGLAAYKRYKPHEIPPFQPDSYQKIASPRIEGKIKIIGRVRRTVADM